MDGDRGAIAPSGPGSDVPLGHVQGGEFNFGHVEPGFRGWRVECTGNALSEPTRLSHRKHFIERYVGHEKSGTVAQGR